MKVYKKYVLFFLISTFLIVLILSFVYYDNSSKFTIEKWELYPEERHKIIKSLINENNLIGQNRSQIKEMLGENEIILENKDMIEYFISPGLGDIVGFILYFNENDIVYNYKISPH